MTNSRDPHANFRSRLEALRHGKQAPSSPPEPSVRQDPSNIGRQKANELKTRLSPPPKKNPDPPPSQPVEPVLGKQNIPMRAQPEAEEKTQIWNAEYGGICPACDYFNPGHVVFCQFCEFMLLRSDNNDIEVTTSYPLKQIRGLALTFIDKLAELKINTTEDILRVAASKQNRAKMSSWTGLSERTLLKLVHTSDLCRIPSINPECALILDFIAIPTLSDLLQQSAEKIHAKIQQNKNKINQLGILVMPTRKQVSQWLEEAKELPPIKIV